jgi:ribonuclease III family protein
MSKIEEDFQKELSGNLNKRNINEYSPLNLAYLGDAVFELLARGNLVTEHNTSVNNLHKRARNIVKAQSQAKMYHKIIDSLTAEELMILKRGRNAKSFTSAKNASVSEYRHATGVEALFGYLFLIGDTSRIFELFIKCTED